MSYDINEEWKNFISSGHEDDDISDDELEDIKTCRQRFSSEFNLNQSFY